MKERGVMEEKNTTEKLICWLNEKEKILSFHYEDGYEKKEFQSHLDYKMYLLYAASNGYRIQ